MSLVIPMVEGLQEVLEMYNLYPVEPYDTFLNCFSGFFFLFATGLGFILYTALITKGVNQLRERRKQT
jgi:hypothetical protein